jgi:hypothetical protein
LRKSVLRPLKIGSVVIKVYNREADYSLARKREINLLSLSLPGLAFSTDVRAWALNGNRLIAVIYIPTLDENAR